MVRFTTYFVLLSLVVTAPFFDQLALHQGHPEYSFTGRLFYSAEERADLKQRAMLLQEDSRFAKKAGRREFILCMSYEDWKMLTNVDRERWRSILGRTRTSVEDSERCFYPLENDFGYGRTPQ